MQDDILVIPTLGGHRADEVLTYAFTATQNTLLQNVTNGALQPLSKARVERNLDAVELNHSRDRDDDPYSVFSGEGLPGNMVCCYLIEGEDNDILRLHCAVDLPVLKEKWGQALLLCNDYHGQSRFGKAYLRMEEGEAHARLYFSACIDLSDGVTDDYLQRYIMLSLYAAHVFFEKTRKAKLFAPAHPRKRSKTTPKKELSQPK
jgi:hypothetical protein